ncbi:hypothetical protein ACSBR1_041774 [Camellia fascicularis]
MSQSSFVNLESGVRKRYVESISESFLRQFEFEKKQAKDSLSDTELESCANKHELESSCTKKQAKDSLSDTVLESANKQTISSQLAELVSNNQVASSENSSTCSGNSSSEVSLNEEEESKNDTCGAVSTSLFVREIPKDFSSTGIRKITFKFSKRKEDYDNQLSATAVGSGSDGISQWNHSASDDMNTEISSYGKVLLDSYPTTVKKLLSTGILEGGRVKYVIASQERELPGIIKGCGYLCGCSLCNFSKILSAYEFELHAGGKTRHPKSLQENSHMVKTEKRRHISVPGMHHATTSGQLIEDSLCPTLSSYVQNYDFKQQNCMKEALEGKKKGLAKKPSFYHSSSVVKQKKTAEGRTKKR